MAIQDVVEGNKVGDLEAGKDEFCGKECGDPPKTDRKSKGYFVTTGLGVFALAIAAVLALSSRDNSDPLPDQLVSRKLDALKLVIDDETGAKIGVNEQLFISPENDPIPVSIRLMHPSIMDGYPSGDEGCDALTADIYNASALIANEVIKDHAKEWYRHYGSGVTRRYRAAASERAPGNAVGEDSYETNNQESGVDEADIIKSDGEHVFVAYGDILVVWDKATGEELSRTRIPARKALTPAEGGSEHDSQRKARIAGLLLDTDSSRLVVIATGYSSTYRYGTQPVLSKTGDIRVFLHDVSSASLPEDGSELILVSSAKMDGEYVSAREVNGAAHIVRRSDVDTYNHISRHLAPNQDDFWRDNKGSYIEHATSKAKAFLPTFAQRVTDELKGISGGNDCSSIARVVLFASAGNDGNRDGLPDSLASAILRSYLQVSSFVIGPPPQREESSLTTNTAGCFFPSSDSKIYASEDVLVVAGRGYHCNARSWGQSTYFFAYQLHHNGTTPTGLGMTNVPGYLLNQFSMDEYNGYLRVATTQNSRWACVPGYFRCRWEQIYQSKSQLAVLKFPQKYGELELIKVIDNLGVTERIKSVRFFDDRAYLVTFRMTDPLYTINFTDPKEPFVSDELKISGYSSYLHPAGNDRLIAIGKDVNESNGRIIGFQISLFNVTELENTSLLQRHTIRHRWAQSSAEGDHLAFRYLPISKLLILPISIRTYEWDRKKYGNVTDFDGFKVFYVSDEGIESRFSISMASAARMQRWCWYYAYLPPRSLVFSGNLTVVKGHGYASYELDTEKLRWEHNLDQNVRSCSSYWG